MIQAVLAALAAVAGLAGKASKDAADARAQKRARDQHRQDTVQGLLQARAQAGGADTMRSSLAARDQQFIRNLAANQRDTSGDWLPFVNALSGVAQGVASDIGRNPPKAKPLHSNAAFSDVIDKYDPNDPAKRSMLMGIAKKNGWY